MIVCLHGFLGSASDFDFMREGKCPYYALEIDDFVDESLEAIASHLFTKSQGKQIILVGYSFGARLALRLFLYAPDKFSHMYLLAGHVGLRTEKQMEERIAVETQFMQNVANLSKEEFSKYWNNLSIFEHDQPRTLTKFNPETLNKYFSNWRLSSQPYMGDDLLKFKSKVTWFFGKLDTKYSEYAMSELREFNVTYIEKAGHRLLDNNEIQKFLLELE